MLHNVALIPSKSKINTLNTPKVDVCDGTFTPEFWDDIVHNLLKIWESIDSLVIVFSKLKF